MRIIARLDVKGPNLIKSINLEGLRVMGNPNDFAKKYYRDGADELIFMDAVASLYGRNNLFDIIKKCTKKIFIPITVGGGLRSIEDISKALSSGADKVALNSAVVKNPELIKTASQTFGSSTIVISIETKKNQNNQWEIFTSTGRDPTGIILDDWIETIQKFGCGEILITSIDCEGTKKGFDIDLINLLKKIEIKVPLIISGGCGNLKHIKEVKDELSNDAVALGSVLHYNLLNLKQIKDELK